MSRVVWFSVLVSLLLSDTRGLTAADCHPCQGVARNPPRQPRPGDSANNSYAGVVTAVDKNSITIQWVNIPGEKPKTFTASDTLAAGKPGIEPRRLSENAPPPTPMMTEYMFRLKDVKVGDCVGIRYARIDGVDICDHIRIWRRPDGEVPPLTKEAEDLRDEREVWKKKHPGRPVPDYLAKRPYVPYHEWINDYWARIAPMPREVKP